MMRPARRIPGLFLDRDGVIFEDTGYIRRVEDAQWIHGSLDALARMAQSCARIVVVTNQSGVGRGLISVETIESIHEQLRETATRAGARIDAIYYCPHHPTLANPPYRVDCECRKPKPGMLIAAAQDLNLDLSKSVMVGDRITDLEAGRRVGAMTVQVGASSPSQLANLAFPSLSAASVWLEKHFASQGP